MAEPNYRVTERRTERVRVTMEWEIDVPIEDTEGGGVKCVGWLAPGAGALMDKLTPESALKATVTRVEADA